MKIKALNESHGIQLLLCQFVLLGLMIARGHAADAIEIVTGGDQRQTLTRRSGRQRFPRMTIA